MRRTKSGLPRWCSWNRDRADGKRRVIFRRKDCKLVCLPGAALVRGIHARQCRLRERHSTRATTTTTIKPGSIDELIESYYTLVFPAEKNGLKSRAALTGHTRPSQRCSAMSMLPTRPRARSQSLRVVRN